MEHDSNKRVRVTVLMSIPHAAAPEREEFMQPTDCRLLDEVVLIGDFEALERGDEVDGWVLLLEWVA